MNNCLKIIKNLKVMKIEHKIRYGTLLNVEPYMSVNSHEAGPAIVSDQENSEGTHALSPLLLEGSSQSYPL